jgi:hypothetical protein
MKDGLLECSRTCRKLKIPCPHQECRHWVEYPDDYNCTLVAVHEHGPLTLREVALRLQISFARVKQIESAALQKLKRKLLDRSLFF